MAIIPNITGICKRPLQAIISPKSVPVALTIKLLTVSVSPDVKANKWLQDISTPDFSTPNFNPEMNFQSETFQLCTV